MSSEWHTDTPVNRRGKVLIVGMCPVERLWFRVPLVDGQGIVLPRAGWVLNSTSQPPKSVTGASWGLLGVSWGCPGGRLRFAGVVCCMKSMVFGVGSQLLVSFVEWNPQFFGFGFHLLWSFVAEICTVWGQLPYAGVVCWVKSNRFEEKWNPFDLLRLLDFLQVDGWTFISVWNPCWGAWFLLCHQLKAFAPDLALVLPSKNVFGMVAFPFGPSNWFQTHGGNGQGCRCVFWHRPPEEHIFLLSSLLLIEFICALRGRSQQMCKLPNRRLMCLHTGSFRENACPKFPTNKWPWIPLLLRLLLRTFVGEHKMFRLFPWHFPKCECGINLVLMWL